MTRRVILALVLAIMAAAAAWAATVVCPIHNVDCYDTGKMEPAADGVMLHVHHCNCGGRVPNYGVKEKPHEDISRRRGLAVGLRFYWGSGTASEVADWYHLGVVGHGEERVAGQI